MAIEKKKLSELRVVDLREELEKRGLEKGGTKPVLIERLKKAIEDEGGDPNEIEVEAGEKTGVAKKAAGARRTPVRRPKKGQEEASAEEPAEDGMETETADAPDSLSLKDEPMDDLDVLDEDDSVDQVELNREAVKAAMKVVYHLAKKEIPHHTNFKDLVNFAVDELGCEVLGRLRVAENAMYTSSTIVDEFLAVLGKQVEETQLTTISGSQFLGLMCDETVDISTTNEMVLYCRCIDDNGELQAKFLKVIALRDGKADTVKKALTDYLEEKDISIQKVAGFGSDGAPCMIGSKTGVAKQLKDDNAKIVSIHCVAHRLALAVGQAGNNVKHIGEVFKPNLLSLFLYYHGSAVRSEGLKEIQEMDTIDDLGEEDEDDLEETSAVNGDEEEEETPGDAVAMETTDAQETVAMPTEGEEEVAEVSAEAASGDTADVTAESTDTPAETSVAGEEATPEGAVATETAEPEMDAASLVDKVLSETVESADDTADALTLEQEEELLTEDEVGEGEAEAPAVQKDKEGSNKNAADDHKETPAEAAKPAGAKVVAPGDAPVQFPLTSDDLIEMATSATGKDEEENISLVVHADDQMIADLDADLLDTPKEAPASTEGTTSAEEPGKEAAKTEETAKEPVESQDGDKKEEGKGKEDAKKATAEPEKSKESSTSAKKSPSVSARTRSASGKDAKDPKAAANKDDKPRHSSSSSSSKNLWVSGLSSTTRATDLKAAFSKYGKVVGAKVVTNARSPGARCYGFVTMSSSEEAARCITHLHRTELHGRMISVERAKNDPSSSSKKPPEKKEPEKRELRPSSSRKPSADARKPPAKKDDKEKEKKEPEKKPEEKKDEKEEKKEEEKRAGSQSRRSTSEKPAAAPAAAKDKEGKEEGADKDAKDETRTVVMDKKKGEPVITVKDSKRDSKSKEKDGQPPRKGSKEKQGEILSFDKIKEQRERERQRQRERELREMERRRVERERRERERQREIIQREREERERLQRERDRLQRERERLVREKQERERLERERMRIERERAREQERIAREREETRRLQLQLEEERRQLKRALEAPRERDAYWASEPKRQYEGDFHRGRQETNRFNDYDNRDRGPGYTRDVDHRSAAPPPDPYERRVERYDRRDNNQRRDDQPARYNDNSRDVRDIPPRRDDMPHGNSRREEPRRDIRDRDARRTPAVPRDRDNRQERGDPRGARGREVPPRDRPADRPARSRSPHRRGSPRPQREDWKSERNIPAERRDSRSRPAGSTSLRGGMDPLSKDERRPRDPVPARDDWGPPEERSRPAAPRASASNYGERQQISSDNRPGLLGPAPSRGGESRDSRDWGGGDRLRKAEPQRQPGTDGHGWPMGGLENPTVNRLGERWPGSMGGQQVDSRGQTRGVLAVNTQQMSTHQRTAGGYVAQQHHAQVAPATQMIGRQAAVGGGFGGPDRHKPAQDNRFDPYSRAPPARRY